MAFTTVTPAPPLRGAIETIWDWVVDPGDFRFERVLPQPGSALIINLLEDQTRVYTDDEERRCERLPGTVFSGQSTRSFVIDSAEQIAVMGVAFRPGGTVPFFRERMDLLCDRHTALEDLAGAPGRVLRERLLHARDARERLAILERWLAARFAAIPLHPAVGFALGVFSASPLVQRVGEVIDASGMSARRFGTLFREQVGIGAKRFARMQRFRAVVAQVQRGCRIEWAHVAADCGFHDQPHLVREFREFSGMTPAAYVAQRGQHVNHIALPD
ncbi:helix-turn-helix domain-containing protein [Dokdonella soli]|uniref:HTH araC/xylS-type domain-containing protein n=1 Tax=Dokdonella soli TaxID=529810 RepID=A0ABN1ICF9_9GAMM